MVYIFYFKNIKRQVPVSLSNILLREWNLGAMTSPRSKKHKEGTTTRIQREGLATILYIYIYTPRPYIYSTSSIHSHDCIVSVPWPGYSHNYIKMVSKHNYDVTDLVPRSGYRHNDIDFMPHLVHIHHDIDLSHYFVWVHLDILHTT